MTTEELAITASETVWIVTGLMVGVIEGVASVGDGLLVFFLFWQSRRKRGLRAGLDGI